MTIKPQLVMQNFGGKSAESMTETRDRLIRGASWKQQRIVCIIPTADKIPAKVVLSWMNLIAPPNQAFVRILALGMEIGEAYSNTIQGILDHPELSKWEYILTVEHDNAPPIDGIIKLIEDMEAHPELACIGGLYFTKGEMGVPQIWGDVSDPVLNYRPQVPVIDGLQECYGTGMGFNLFRLSMFRDERLRKPWFKTTADKTGIGTQDLYFWSDARKHGYRCAVDTRIKVGHYDSDNDVMW